MNMATSGSETHGAGTLSEAAQFASAFAVTGLFVGVLLMFLTFLAAGGGHGSYLLAKLAFPYNMLTFLFADEMPVFTILGAFVQFPVYGLVLGMSYRFRRLWTVVLLLAALHVVAVVLCLRLLED